MYFDCLYFACRLLIWFYPFRHITVAIKVLKYPVDELDQEMMNEFDREVISLFDSCVFTGVF